MDLKDYWETYMLTKKLNENREKSKNAGNESREMCENYFRCDDEEGDGRGIY